MTDTHVSMRRPPCVRLGPIAAACLLLSIATIDSAIAQSGFHKNEARVEISGSIYAKFPCIINDKNPINIPFGEVQISKLQEHPTVPIPYTLNCDRAATNALKLQIKGNPADFTSAGFTTALLQIPNQTDLGIAIMQGKEAVGINNWLSFDNPKSPPVLHAVLVARNLKAITAGEFSAWATMVVDYQ